MKILKVRITSQEELMIFQNKSIWHAIHTLKQNKWATNEAWHVLLLINTKNKPSLKLSSILAEKSKEVHNFTTIIHVKLWTHAITGQSLKKSVQKLNDAKEKQTEQLKQPTVAEFLSKKRISNWIKAHNFTAKIHVKLWTPAIP